MPLHYKRLTPLWPPWKPTGPCPAGERCKCIEHEGWNCTYCGRCCYGCVPPCLEAVHKMEWRKKHLGESEAKKSEAPPMTTKTVTSGLPRNPPSQSKEPSDSVSMQNSPKPGTSRAEDTSKSKELSLQKMTWQR